MNLGVVIAVFPYGGLKTPLLWLIGLKRGFFDVWYASKVGFTMGARNVCIWKGGGSMYPSLKFLKGF